MSVSRWLLIAVLMAWHTVTLAQTEPILATGSDVFRALLLHQGLEPVNYTDREAPQTVFVIFGHCREIRTANPTDLTIVQNLLLRGGAVLIVTDQNASLNGHLPLEWTGHAIDGQRVVDNDRDNCYRNNPEMPYLKFNVNAAGTDHDLRSIATLTRVATNQPSFVSKRPNIQPRLRAFGTFADSATIADSDRTPGACMALGTVGQGVAVVLADAGVLANQMLVAQGEASNDNFAFAMHLASFLTHANAGSSPRTRCVFYDMGRLHTDFDRVSLTPQPPVPQPSWAALQKAMADGADRKINELQDADFPTKNLVRAVARNEPGYSSPPEKLERANRRLTVILAAGCAILTLVLVLRAIRRGMAETELTTKKTTAETNDLVDSLWAANNLYPAVREKLRSQFEQWGIPPAKRTPEVAVDGSRFYRNRMTRTVQRLWQLTDQPRSITRRQWQDLDLQIREVNDAVRSGIVRFPEATA